MKSQQISADPLIICGFNLCAEIQDWLVEREFSRIFILVDGNTFQYCLPLLIGQTPALRDALILEAEPGEESKSIEVATGLWQTLLENDADRNALLINLGGGMITDLGGFIASTYMRGISFMNLPTSLLAMIDAATGGKTGINFSDKKNIIGVFQKADAVFADLTYLQTLPEEHFISGTAEIAKHALLQGTQQWQDFITTDFSDSSNLENTVAESISFKSKITSHDFKEAGKRAQLNLGHTVAHALESFYLKNRRVLLHGNAVAAGLIIESQLAILMSTGLPEKISADILNYVKNNFPSVSFSENDIDDLIDLMRNDKKNRDSQIYFSLLQDIGKCLPPMAAEKHLIAESLKIYIRVAGIEL